MFKQTILVPSITPLWDAVKVSNLCVAFKDRKCTKNVFLSPSNTFQKFCL